MVSIQLDPVQQQRLDQLAKSQGQDSAALARRVILDYLDFQAITTDPEEAWAEASVALAPEVMGQENWSKSDNGP
jgi:predicted transcriptional regulator